nr:RsmB/NOP family class I SAM-dependent RNA methyltransferase [Pseudenhygromyxa sp. WMMC2535]
MISIQSLGSQQAVRALDPRPGERIIDACAGMGTKTAQIAELMQRQGRLVAMDASAERLAELEAARERVDLDAEGLALEIVHADLAEDPLELDIELEPGSVDGLLLDAPCTGLGNLARHPELRWTAEPGDVPACAALQATLLRRCADWVRPGGRLVYAVCSLEPEEGPQVVADFVAERGEFRVVKEEAWTPEGARSDGFWLARLERG